MLSNACMALVLCKTIYRKCKAGHCLTRHEGLELVCTTPYPKSMTRSGGGGIDSQTQVFTLRLHWYGLVIQLHMGDIFCSLF